MLNDNPYELLGVEKDASVDEIKRAYRRLALKYHPDKNAGDEKAAKQFRKISEAYEILSDEGKRAAFDQGGMKDVETHGHEGFDNEEDIYSRFGDIFGDRFGDRYYQPRATPRRGRDLRFALTTPFRDAALGSNRDITVPIEKSCAACSGSGLREGESLKTCPSCRGTGHSSRQGQREGGFFSVSSECSTCHGSGHLPVNGCPQCNGTGRVAEHSVIGVKIPVGVNSGQVLRLAGQGEAGLNGGPAGDLLVEIEVEPDPTFTREGLNVRSDVSVPVGIALLGGKVDLPTLRGTGSLTIPAGTSSDRVLRVRGQGIWKKEQKGDQLARVVVTVPEQLSKEAQEAVRTYLASESKSDK
ncbi:MAG: molecular chaperone DnaJ [Pirellulaceae bacterium]|nr:molecular chaperone DnaJ [Pirellulaceae bacterium]